MVEHGGGNNSNTRLSPADRCELASQRLIFSALRLWLFDIKANFDPNQPRVPAGLPSDGQWTDTDGPFGRTPIRLQDEEGGSHRGHAIRKHVGKTNAQLKARVRQKQTVLRYVSKIPGVLGRVVDKAGGVVVFSEGSFSSTETANKLVRSTLARNDEVVELVATGKIKRGKAIVSSFKSPTGKEAYARGLSQPRIRPTYRVRVVIRYNENSERGYNIITAFPIR